MVRKIDVELDERVETGAVQIGENDWPGLFLRGDDALMLMLILRDILHSLKLDPFRAPEIEMLCEMIENEVRVN